MTVFSSASEATVESWRLEFVVGDAGEKVGAVVVGAVLAIVTVLDWVEPFVVLSFGVTSRVITSPLEGFTVAGRLPPVQLEVVLFVDRSSVSVWVEPDASKVSVVDWI